VDTAALTPVEAARLAVHRRFVEIYISLGSGEAYAPILAEMTAVLDLFEGDPVAALAHALISACHTALTQDAGAVCRHAELAMERAVASSATGRSFEDSAALPYASLRGALGRGGNGTVRPAVNAPDRPWEAVGVHRFPRCGDPGSRGRSAASR
jgi:hypothetical protein